MTSVDGIIIGAGHNGLTCACYLARAGMRVLVLEAAPEIGGMTSTRELVHPGFWTDVHASGYQLAGLASAPAELELDLTLIRPAVSLSKIFADQQRLDIKSRIDDTCASIAGFSTRDAETWRRLYADYWAGKPDLRQELENPPPAPGTALTAITSRPHAQQRLRLHYASVRSWAAETFESAAVRDLMADFAAHAGFAPDDAGGAKFALLFLSVIQDTGNQAVKGGMGQLPAELARCLRTAGGQIRTGAQVARVRVSEGAVAGVELVDGTVLHSKLVVSSAHPRQLVVDLLPAVELDRSALDDLHHYALGTSQMGIYLALSAPVDYRAGPEAATATQVHLMPSSTDALAESFRAIRAGRLPDPPSVFVVNEATVDPSRVPAGRSALKIILTTVPYGVDWTRHGPAYAASVVQQIDQDYLPGLQQHTIARRIMTPVDYEHDLLTSVQGTVTHGAMTLDQQGAMRPTLSLGQYRGPIPGLYLCGAGSHPGPGVSMMPGRNAAHAVLADGAGCPPGH